MAWIVVTRFRTQVFHRKGSPRIHRRAVQAIRPRHNPRNLNSQCLSDELDPSCGKTCCFQLKSRQCRGGQRCNLGLRIDQTTFCCQNSPRKRNSRRPSPRHRQKRVGSRLSAGQRPNHRGMLISASDIISPHHFSTSSAKRGGQGLVPCRSFLPGTLKEDLPDQMNWGSKAERVKQ